MALVTGLRTEANMATILDSSRNLDQTVRIFDAFYSYNLVVNAGEFDVVHSYFVGICQDAQIAANFTTFFFRISQENQLPVMDLLDAIKGLDKLNMNRVLAYYMNSFKSKTSLYGVAVVPQPNQNVYRNILQ